MFFPAENNARNWQRPFALTVGSAWLIKRERSLDSGFFHHYSQENPGQQSFRCYYRGICDQFSVWFSDL